MVGNENISHFSLKTRLFQLFEKYAIDLIRGSDKMWWTVNYELLDYSKKKLSQEKYL